MWRSTDCSILHLTFVFCVSVREAKVYCVYNVDSEFVLCITMVVSLGFCMYSYIMSIPFLV